MSKLPAPERTTEGVESWTGKPDRTMTSRWVTDVTCEDIGKTGHVVIDLYTRHNKSRGDYVTDVVKREVYAGFERTAYGNVMSTHDGENSATIYSVPGGARYSVKALREAHAAALAAFTTESPARGGHLRDLIPTECPVCGWDNGHSSACGHASTS